MLRALPPPAGGYGGERPPQGGGAGPSGIADTRAERDVSSVGAKRIGVSAIRAMRRPRPANAQAIAPV
jgi:hypothetical protein